MDLRYPVGRFVRPEKLSDDERRAAIDAISAAPGNLRAAVRGLDDAQLETPYRPDGWTVRQVVHHVPESHLNAYSRFKLALTEDTPTIKPYDEDAWANTGEVSSTPIETSLVLLEALHDRWVRLLRSMKTAEFDRAQPSRERHDEPSSNAGALQMARRTSRRTHREPAVAERLVVTRRDIENALLALPHASTTAVRTMRRGFSKQIRGALGRDVLALAVDLVASGEFLERFVAYELVLHHPEARAAVTERSARALGAGIDDWAAVDTFACYVAGPAWREGQIPDAAIRRWAGSRDRWWRRAAVVCTVALNNAARGGSGDTARTLDICRRVIDDRDDMVIKAVSWALRELSKRDAASVASFLVAYADRLAPRVKREVRNKLTTGLKSGARRGKPRTAEVRN